MTLEKIFITSLQLFNYTLSLFDTYEYEIFNVNFYLKMYHNFLKTKTNIDTKKDYYVNQPQN